MSALAGRRIVVTRAAHQADALAGLIRTAGGVPVTVPAIVIGPPESWSVLDDALRRIADHDWVVFTSANGVEAAFARAAMIGLDAEDWRRVRVAAVGPATAAALRRRGVRTHAVPEEHRAERIASVMGGLPGARVLMLRGQLADPVLHHALEARGARADDVIAYRTLPASPDAAAIEQVCGADAITFTSGSAARGLAVVLDMAWPDALQRAVIASIGPTTTRALRELGVPVTLEASPHTAAALVSALERFWADAHASGTRHEPA